MPAYFIAEIDVQDAAAFEDYRRQVPAAIAPYGGRYLARGGGAETLEGDWQPARVVVLEFPSRERAREFYDSPEYAPLKALRLRATRSRLLLLDGVPPPDLI
jgi:uncharacterized protein (DUF1330 family)